MTMSVPPEPTDEPAAAMPSVFVGVGGPTQIEDAAWSADLRGWAAAMPRPKAILVFSAHWLRYPVTLGATRPVPLVYDYYNFPQRFYEVEYSAPPAPALAERFVEIVGDQLEVETSERGLDHGAFIGLMGMYPEASVPVLEVSIPTFHPESLFAIGRELAPLRQEGVMVMGAGLLTHGAPVPEANQAFDAWVVETLARRDVEALLNYRELAPHVETVLPTPEHFVPLFLAYGAAYDGGGAILSGFDPGPIGRSTRRSFQFD
jgi:4,5-DOPA dioxygenase extradiol